MIKRIKLPGWIVIIVLVVLLITGISQLAHAGMKKAANRNPEINKMIEQWIDEQKGHFLEGLEGNETMPGKGFRADLNIQLETHKITDDYYSLVFTVNKDSGEANGQSIEKVFNVDLGNDKLLEIDDVLNIDEDTLKNMSELVEEALRKDEDLYFYIMDDLFDEALSKPDEWIWSLNQSALTLYFDENEIAAGVAGPIRVEIPIDKISLYLNEDIDSLLDIPKEQQKEKGKINQGEKATLDPDGKYVALTFDDGPSAEVTPRVLRILKEHEIQATFFMLGSQVDYYPNLARQVAEAGHEIGNHTKGHPDLTKLGPEGIRSELNYTDDKIQDATGTRPNLIRPPYGAYNDDVINYAKKNGDSLILWSVDSLDWKSRNADTEKNVIQKGITPGAIVLMHDIHPTTADALPELLITLESEGYQFVTVSRLLELHERNGVGPYYGNVK